MPICFRMQYDSFKVCCVPQWIKCRLAIRQVCPEKHRDWGPCLPVGPASWTMGTDNLKLCTIGKKMFCTGPTGSAVQFFMLPLPSKIHRLNSVSEHRK